MFSEGSCLQRNFEFLLMGRKHSEEKASMIGRWMVLANLSKVLISGERDVKETAEGSLVDRFD
jgi:hypothetical protein